MLAPGLMSASPLRVWNIAVPSLGNCERFDQATDAPDDAATGIDPVTVG